MNESDIIYIDSLEKLKNNLDILDNLNIWFLDTETTFSDIRLLQIGDKEGPIYVIDFFYVKEAPDLLRPIIQRKPIVGHNLKFDLKHLYKLKLYPYTTFDTMIAAQMLGFERVSLAKIYEDVEKSFLDKSMQLSNWAKDILSKEQIVYAAKDVEALRKIFFVLRDRLNSESFLKEPLEKSRVHKAFNLLNGSAIVEMGFVGELAKIEMNGFYIDKEKAKELSNIFEKTLQKMSMDFYVKYRTDPLSSKQLGQLFTKLGLNLPISSKDNIITDDKALIEYIDLEPVKLVLEIRKIKKLLEKIKELLEHEHNSRVYPEFKQIGSITGRMSSNKPNVQNVPRELREIFGAPENHSLVIGDFSQIELRIVADYVKDDNMIKVIREGKDLHRYTASLISGKKEEDITKKERDQAKAANFGLIYGISPKSLAEYAKNAYSVEMSLEEAMEFQRVFFDHFKKIKEWHDYIKKELKEKKEFICKTILGRVLKAYTFTDAANYPIQGTGADLLKLSVLVFDNELKRENLKAKVVNLVHDEIVVECKEEDAEKVKNILEISMKKAGSMVLSHVHLDVELFVNKNWKKLK